jgi:hypothetical protein
MDHQLDDPEPQRSHPGCQGFQPLGLFRDGNPIHPIGRLWALCISMRAHDGMTIAANLTYVNCFGVVLKKRVDLSVKNPFLLRLFTR